VIGRIAPDASGRRHVTLKFTYDERVEDGLYCARTLERLREWLEHPEKL
jgi:pyruvate/2-oxoglutarate dehydrogenase complex dihydrolipoamide acyltransferase (E2) component